MGRPMARNLLKAGHPLVVHSRGQGPVNELVEAGATARDGYSGDIKLLIGVRQDGSLGGVRVIAHKETPGLGDYIDIAKDNWIKSFDDLSLTSRPSKQWQVKKDGGQFDYMAGATITPRAVVKATHKALTYVELNKTLLFATHSSKQ